MKKLIVGIALYSATGMATGQISVPVMLKDFYSSNVSNYDLKNLTDVNGTLFFTSTDEHGTELWKSNGTPSGTVMVKDIYAGANDSDPKYLTDVNGVLFFIANDGVHGNELWKSDGTEGGTVLVKDINPGPGSGSTNAPNMISINGILFFAANDGTSNTNFYGHGLWKSDGTEAGTVLVQYLTMGEGNIGPYVANLNGTLLFNAVGATAYGNELWKSDGTDAGTVLVKDINPGIYGSSTPAYMATMNGEVYFNAWDGSNYNRLWKSDGTGSGTIMNSAGLYNPKSLININSTLFLVGGNGQTGNSLLWKSDGTELGTIVVKDIYPNGNPGISYLTDVDGSLFFVANDGIHGSEVWKSDGTELGTIMVRDISTQSSSSPQFLTAHGGYLYFSTIVGYDLWRTDGTEAGTISVGNFSGSYASPSYMTHCGNLLFFTAGLQLWVLGAPAAQVESITQNNISVFPNPSHEKLTITSDLSQGGIIEIYNITGVKIFSQSVSSLALASIDISGQANGTYVIKVSCAGNVWTQRIIKK